MQRESKKLTLSHQRLKGEISEQWKWSIVHKTLRSFNWILTTKGCSKFVSFRMNERKLGRFDCNINFVSNFIVSLLSFSWFIFVGGKVNRFVNGYLLFLLIWSIPIAKVMGQMFERNAPEKKMHSCFRWIVIDVINNEIKLSQIIVSYRCLVVTFEMPLHCFFSSKNFVFVL